MSAVISRELKVRVARRFHERALGLIVEPQPISGQGLLFERCAGVHTFFMRYPIDVVFLDRDSRVLKVAHHVKPWRLVWCRGAHQVLELRQGDASLWGVREQQLLRWS